jgi:ketosteroid isomerase-like protein
MGAGGCGRNAGSIAVSARPSLSSSSMTARAGSPISEATREISGPSHGVSLAEPGRQLLRSGPKHQRQRRVQILPCSKRSTARRSGTRSSHRAMEQSAMEQSMSSEDNKQIVLASYRSFSTRDRDEIASHLAPEPEWIASERNGTAVALGVPPGFKGREAIVHYLAEDVGGRLFRDGKVDIRAVVADRVASSSNRCSRRPCATGVLTE